MRKTLLTLSLTIGLLGVLVSPAVAVDLNDVIRTLETPFQSATKPDQRIYDYKAEFFQESRIASLDRLQRARGRVVVAFDYQHPDQVPTVRFRWEYDQPTTQEIVSDGKTLWVYLPENNQVIQSDITMVNKAQENDPMTFLTGLGNLSRDFLISWADPNQDINGNYILDLRPRKSSALINRLVIVVNRMAVKAHDKDKQVAEPSQAPPAQVQPADSDHQSGEVRFPVLSTSIYDPNGNTTMIEFSELQVNRGVSAALFNFIKPAGVQVVRPAGPEMGF
jgi:outer membrane lipoprotein carrier protein